MSATEENKAAVRAWGEAMNRGDLEAAFELVAPDCVEHSLPPGMPGGKVGARAFFESLVAAFPGIQGTIDDMVAEGDRVVTRTTISGVHSGPFMGIPATGKPVSFISIDIVRYAGGKQAEHWGLSDFQTLLQQIGAAPIAEPAGR